MQKLNTVWMALVLCVSLTACVDEYAGDNDSNEGNNNDTQCLAYPTCEEGANESTTPCEDDEVGCSENSLCGATVYCREELTTCAAIPVCDDNEIEVASCDGDGLCREVSECGATIHCQEIANDCLAYPSCDADEYQVDACPQDTSCREVSLCSVTILCAEPIDCEAYPSCGPNEHESMTPCEEGEACYDNTVCGATVFCRPQGLECDAEPVCAAGEYTVQDCPEGVSCREVTVCGATILCAEDLPSDCQAYPTCTDAEYESDEPCAEDEDNCYERVECGYVVYCRG